MESTAKLLFTEMTEQIAAITPSNILHRAELCYQITKSSIRKLTELMEPYIFRDQDEEIRYYKTIQPKFMKEHIYYTELYHLESLKPCKEKASVAQYYKDALNFNNQYFGRNITFYNYYRAGRTNHDHILFVKEPRPSSLPPLGTVDSDSHILPPHSYKLARFQALEILNNYIGHELNKLEAPHPHRNKSNQLSWTDSKVALIELIYAIYSKGAINNGNADIQTIINTFQETFQINLGNYSSAFHQNIRIRKKNRAVYLIQLKEYLDSHMDEMDENPRFI